MFRPGSASQQTSAWLVDELKSQKSLESYASVPSLKLCREAEYGGYSRNDTLHS
jgi:hypothetical protein